MTGNNSENIFDNVFNRTCDLIKPESDMEPIWIDSGSIASIPGVIRHWCKETQKRKKDILKYENRGFFARFFDWIRDDEDTDDPSGGGIYKIAPTREARDLMEKIENNPTDRANRLELVAYVLNHGRIITIKAARDLFLQGTVACCFGKLCVKGLRTCLFAQDKYFRLLLERCNHDHEKVKSLLATTQRDDLFAQQKQLLIDYQKKIGQNMQLIESYLKHTAAGIELLSGNSGMEISIAELNKDLTNQSAANKARMKELYDKAFRLLSAIRFLPLLHEEGLKYIDLLYRLDREHPLPLILKARILRAKLVFLMKQREAGDLDKELENLIKDRFLLTYGTYEEVIDAKSLYRDSELARISRLELARLIIDCRLFYHNFLNKKLPGQADEVYRTKARHLLVGLGKNKVAKELLEKLESRDESQ